MEVPTADNFPILRVIHLDQIQRNDILNSSITICNLHLKEVLYWLGSKFSFRELATTLDNL